MMLQFKEKSENEILLEKFVNNLNKLSEEDLMIFVDRSLNRVHDRGRGIKELHEKMKLFSTLANCFYHFFNDRFYFPSLAGTDNRDEYFTLEEIAKKFDVSEKTISNWEKAGLRVLRPSPRILIISKKDLYRFFEEKS